MNNKFYAQAEAFVTVVRCNSISGAALELKTTKSNISQKLADLEAFLDVTLIKRTTRHMSLTPAGERAFQICERAVDETVNAALLIGALAKPENRPSGRVKVSGSNIYLTKCVLPEMGAFLDSYPDVETIFVGSDLRVDFSAEDIDMGFRIGPIATARNKVIPLKPLKRILCASPKLIDRYGVVKDPRDLMTMPCILREQEQPVWKLELLEERYEHYITEAIFRANTIELSLEGAIQGLGVTLISEVVAADAIAQGQLVQLLPDWGIAPIPVALVLRGTRMNRAQVQALRHYFVSRLA
ncbi:LysR family transcriptional regulator [Amylibacter sp. SFDW26]|uniref:LysR family transcriptional regulator n=1 Tax=Amylibacter sp. SFDW26 TaxID=2652722 RepID=UPI001261C2F9|nr:LysR family transcriptional regulator [Amylibacter sp. SFDW26]KAB7610210.1 LysR family transcriptional regulator [Amylibacter sp. SFDW26]